MQLDVTIATFTYTYGGLIYRHDDMNSVLIVDDHPVARMAVKILLEKDFMTVVGEADNGQKALLLANQLLPDLIVMDLDIPSMNGLEVVQRLRRGGYAGRILVLTGKDDDHYVKRSASVGADGFISKRNNLTELHDAIHALRGGYGYFPLTQARSEAAGAAPSEDKDLIAELSFKELQVLRHLAKGMKMVDIAKLMKISDKTVSTYKRRMMDKLCMTNMMELFDFAQRNNLD